MIERATAAFIIFRREHGAAARRRGEGAKTCKTSWEFVARCITMTPVLQLLLLQLLLLPLLLTAAAPPRLRVVEPAPGAVLGESAVTVRIALADCDDCAAGDSCADACPAFDAVCMQVLFGLGSSERRCFGPSDRGQWRCAPELPAAPC